MKVDGLKSHFSACSLQITATIASRNLIKTSAIGTRAAFGRDRPSDYVASSIVEKKRTCLGYFKW